MAEPKMVSMKRSEKDKRKDMGECAPVDCIAPDYPWGLTLNLGTDELDKLGMKTPTVGEEMTLTVKVRVTSCREDEHERPDGKHVEDRGCTLQVTDIGGL